jgi:hypothetical protein
MTLTITRTIEIDVEFEVEVDGKYRPAVTWKAPEHCSPAEYPEVEVVSAETDSGRDVLRLIDAKTLESVQDEALELAMEAESDAADEAAEQRAEMRRERFDE